MIFYCITLVGWGWVFIADFSDFSQTKRVGFYMGAFACILGIAGMVVQLRHENKSKIEAKQTANQ